jgi:UTP--glucose-1-phosphate uridylyltransferase
VIRKSVIPAAGLGTRFLPATKVLPKEILPVVDKPVIEWGVEEARSAGAEEVLLVLSPGKEILLKHYEPNPELEGYLEERGKLDMLERVRAIGAGVKVTEVLQREPLGLGHAVLQAKDAVGDEFFTALLPDDIFIAGKSVLAQMVAVHDQQGCSVLAVRRVPRDLIGRYGSIAFSAQEGNVFTVTDMVEKPKPEEAPSDLAIMGRYVLSPRIFAELEATPRGAGGEIQLTDGIKGLLRTEKVVALEFEGDYFDVGTIAGWLKTSIALGRARPEFRDDIDAYLRKLLESPPEHPPPTA